MSGQTRPLVGWGEGPHPTLPDPGRYSDGSRPCNEPLAVEVYGPDPSLVIVGYCTVVVPFRRHRKGLGHKGKHRIEWS